MESYNSSSNQNARKILLVGDINKAFLDVRNVRQERYEFCVNMIDAIDAAAKKDFAGIGVVMAGTSAKLSSALRALRESSDAKIVLLAQMYEEPIAIHLVGSACNSCHGYGTTAADDYLICPVRTDRFYESIMTGKADEFAAVFWDQGQAKSVDVPDERRWRRADHPTQAISIAKRFVKELENSELTPLAGLGPAGKGVLTISGGLATFPRDGSTIQELFQQADSALMEAKRSGKNRIYLVGKPQSDIADID